VPVKYKDYYAVLGVGRRAADADIRKAYRRLARQYHPDLNKAAEAQERFQEISEAYEVLGDPEKRRRYDELGSDWSQGQEFRPPPDWEKVHFAFRGNGGIQGSGFSGHDGFSDFFDLIFGDMLGGVRQAGFDPAEHYGASPPRRTHDEADLTLTLDEAFLGVTKRIQIHTGGGAKSRTCNLRIPPGTRDGARLRLRNQGHDGDLLIRISIAPHPRFRVKGADLETDVELTPPEAVLGTTVSLSLIDGRASLRIPPGTASGCNLRLSGKGLKKPGGGRGDLYVVVRIVVPKHLSSREKALYEELAELEADQGAS